MVVKIINGMAHPKWCDRWQHCPAADNPRNVPPTKINCGHSSRARHPDIPLLTPNDFASYEAASTTPPPTGRRTTLSANGAGIAKLRIDPAPDPAERF
jgi:hypothetical protein